MPIAESTEKGKLGARTIDGMTVYSEGFDAKNVLRFIKAKHSFLIKPGLHAFTATIHAPLHLTQPCLHSLYITHGRVEQRLGGLKTNTIMDTFWC